jgi:hypothetical protein
MATDRSGWKALLEGYPWFTGAGHYPLPAYSEFMPAPRLGRRAYGEVDAPLFSEDDLYGWHIPEMQQEHELQPGLPSLAQQIVESLVKLGQGQPAYDISGHQGRNLVDNPCWPPDLAARAGSLAHERYVTILPVALARTQDDKGRVRWTFFGSSEQGPERAFWQSSYSATGQELNEHDSLSFMLRLLSTIYGAEASNATELLQAGFRILPSEPNPRFPYWVPGALPSWTRPFVTQAGDEFDRVLYLLTFRPFGRLPRAVQERYLAGQLVLLPFPGSLVFWGMPSYLRLQEQLPLAMQVPLQRVAARHGGPSGIRVPQSGWLHESGLSKEPAHVREELQRNTYRRTSRWDRTQRYQDEVLLSTLDHPVARVLFGTRLTELGLYDKPMARNCQLWTEGSQLLLDGPNATPEDLHRAAEVVAQGGNFRYRFQFPAMRVGRHEVYWQRPLAAYWNNDSGQVELLSDAPTGYLTAYLAGSPDLAHPVELWPRLLQREAYLAALQAYESASERWAHETALNATILLDHARMWGAPLPRSFAQQLMRLSVHAALDGWLSQLPERASDPARGRLLMLALQAVVEPSPARAAELAAPITYIETATRAYEERYWGDIHRLAHGEFLNKDNADVVRDPVTKDEVPHLHRDLEPLGEYLLGRYREAIAAAGMQGQALCGELPFHWHTDFGFDDFGGWKNNQEGHTHERDLLVVIPGKDRSQAVVLADHYDTAYEEDEYGKTGARLSARGADDNCSATATLLQAAPIFLRLAKEGCLERDVWLLHLTGEEFPADCLGARHVCQALVEKTLRLQLSDKEQVDLSNARVVGVLVMDMIAHNRDAEHNVFQISPGKGAGALRLAYQAHLATEIWNAHSFEWNRVPERKGRERGKRTWDPERIPDIALFPQLHADVRTTYDPHSTLYNTDGQIFSDTGVPVILFMEDYDINRQGYHDTRDTLENIDLDYGAAISAIAIETIARVAAAR